MLSFLLILVFISIVSADTQYNCPSSDAKQHAGCKFHVTFENSCDDVKEEMRKRIAGQYDQWHDPHNNGTYTELAEYKGSLETSRLTGDKKYTDLINFSFEWNSDSVGCVVYGCSQSQVFSIGDAGTNYCNIFSLYCNDDKCQPFTKLKYSNEVIDKCTQADPNVCLP